MAFIDVNTKENIVLTNKLEKLSKSAFPIAVKNTLNDLAFEMKKNQIEKSAKQNGMKIKNKTFFRAFTSVDKASGNSVNSLKATVGWIQRGNSKDTIEGMEKQETGGAISKGLRYLLPSRGGSYNKLVRRSNYYDKSKVLKTKKHGFIKSAAHAKKTNKPLKVKNAYVKVTSFKRLKSGKLTIKTKVLMAGRDSKPTRVKSTGFMKKGAFHTVNLFSEKFYQKNANYQFKKYLK